MERPEITQSAAGYALSWTSLSVCLFTFAYFYFKQKFGYWRRAGLKNPTPVPWFGTTLWQIWHAKPELELQLHQTLGKLYGLYDGYLGTNPTLVCGHPEAIKQITIKHFDSFSNRRRPATWRAIRYRALTYLRDDEWRDMRKTLAPIFTSSKLKKMFALMKKCARNVELSIERESETEIDLKKLFSVYTVDVISTCCFSLDLKRFRHAESELLVSARKFFNVSRVKMTLSAGLPKQLLSLLNFDINDTDSIAFFARFATGIIQQRKRQNANPVEEAAGANLDQASRRQQDDMLQILIDAVERAKSGGCGADNQAGSAEQDVDSFGERQPPAEEDNDEEEESREEREEMEQVDNERQLQLHHQRQQRQANERPEREFSQQQLGDMEILAQTMLFFAVGHETTATLLSSCGYFLALYPELQERLYREVREAFLEDNGDITYEKLLQLNYLDAFVSEALRYFTPTLSFDREASEDVEIQVDGFKLLIPKGMGVIIPFHAIHHDPDNYEEPEKFDPERFMPENRHKIKPCTFIPFGSGPRFCLASRFALMEAKLGLATLVNRFRFVRSESTSWPPTYRHHYMLLQMVWPKIRFVDRQAEQAASKVNDAQSIPHGPQMAA